MTTEVLGSESGSIAKGDASSLARGLILSLAGAVLTQALAYFRGVDASTMLGGWGPLFVAGLMATINFALEFTKKGVFTKEAWISGLKGAAIASGGAMLSFAQEWLTTNPNALSPSTVAMYAAILNLIRLYYSNTLPKPPEEDHQ